jgi:hypothetical protein
MNCQGRKAFAMGLVVHVPYFHAACIRSSSLTISSEIAFAVFHTYLLLGERLIWTLILGAILVIAGVLQLLGKNMKPIEGKFNCLKGCKNHEYR